MNDLSAEIKLHKAAATASKKEIRVAKERALGAKQWALPDDRYGVIVADPGWQFKVYSRETGMDRSAENHYACTSLDDIKAIGVAGIAAQDCVLFLWSTGAMLPQALEVMSSWGFTYKSHAVWAKNKLGLGYWFRNKHEIVLVGTRGRPIAPAPGTQFASLFEAPVAGHSAKPPIFLEMVERYYPTLPKIELNCRGPARDGWANWGAEAE